MKLFKMAQYQTFDVHICDIPFFKKRECGYCIRNLRFVYADSVENAKKIYKQRYAINRSENMKKDWVEIIDSSENLGRFPMEFKKVSNMNNDIVILDFSGNETIENIKAHTYAIDFKRWWNDGGKLNG